MATRPRWGYTDEDGYRMPLRGNVETIKNLLREKYRRGFPVVKEVLQNSDDAKSTKLRFGWTPGLGAGQGNPLLEGPGFIVINDGPFRPEDAENMRNFSSSMQATNGSTIGSFGLGLKSLYHLGEAVLYFSSESGHDGWGDGRQGRRHGALSVWFHPDSDPELRPEWHVVTDAISLVKEHIRPLTDGLERWFCLWVPLRKEAHCVNGIALGDPPPGDPMPGEVRDRPASELMPDDAPEQLASILPMLATLREITYQVADGRGNWDPRYEVTLLDGSRTVSSRGSRAAADAPFKGVIAIRRWDARDGLGRSDPSYSELEYRGHEVVPDDPHLRELTDDPRWPRSVRMPIGGVDSDHEITERVEGDPHAAVYWAVLHDGRGPGSSDGRRFPGPMPVRDVGTLTYSYAVYLPLGDPQEIVISAPIRVWNVRHGRFWVDSGRLGRVVPNPQYVGDRDFKEEWNETLRLTGVEPWVIPTLNQIVELIAERNGSGNLAITATHEAVEALTSSVSKTEWYKLHRDDVCRSLRWISALDPGTGRWEWRQVEGDQGRPLVSIPDPSSETLALAVVPGLRAIANDHAHVVADRRIRLTTTAEDQLATWTVELVELALDSVRADDVLGDLDRLRYLVDFVRHVRTWQATERPGHPDVHAAYCRLLRRMLGSTLARTVLAPARTEPPETLERRSLLKSLVSEVPRGMRWSAVISGASAGAVLGAITVGVMVPGLLEPTDSTMSSTGIPDVRDVKAACVALADLEGYVEDRGHPEEKILGELGVDSRHGVLRDLEDVRFIRVEELGEQDRDRACVVSWRALRTLHERGRLVSGTAEVPPQQRQFLWRLLVDPVDPILDGIRLASISEDAIKTFFNANASLDEQMAVQIVRKAPGLGPPSDRVDGFRWLLTVWHNRRDSARNTGPPGRNRSAVPDGDFALALRYLLHGEPSARESMAEQLLLSRFVDTPGREGWGIGWTLREGLAQVGQAWRVVGNPLASLVDDAAKDGLTIADVTLDRMGREFDDFAPPPPRLQIADPVGAGPPASRTSGVEPLVIRPSVISFEKWKAGARDLILAEFKPAVEGGSVPGYLPKLRIHDRAGDAGNVHAPIDPTTPASYCNPDPPRVPAGDEGLTVELIDSEQGDTYLSDPSCPDVSDELARECFVVRRSEHDNASFVQRKLLSPFDWRCRLEFALRVKEPSRFHREIMDALAEVTGRQDEPLKRKIEGTPWLPLTTGGSTRPADVMLIGRDLADHWQRISSRSASGSSLAKQAPFALDLEVQGHMFWDRLCNDHFLQDKDLITRHICREAVANLPANYATGLPRDGGPTGSEIVGVFGNHQEPVMGFASLLASLWPPLQDLAGQELARAASGPGRPRLQAILGHVASVGEMIDTDGDGSVPGAKHLSFVRVHAAYLSQLGDAQSKRSLLETSSLLSATGAWLPASSLCLSASHPLVVPYQRAHEGYDKHLGDLEDPRDRETSGTGQQVDPIQARMSRGTIGDPPDDPRHRHSGDDLRDFVRPLDTARVPKGLIGAFVTLLGPDERFAGIARELLGGAEEPTEIRGRLARDGVRVGSWRQFVVTVVTGTTIVTVSIAGTPLTVNLVSEPTGHGFVAKVTKTGHWATIDLMMPQDRNDAGTLSRNLKDTADYLISQVYRDARGEKFSAWWNQITLSGDAGVRAEELVVAGSLAAYLREIRIGHPGPVAVLMKAVQDAINHLAGLDATPSDTTVSPAVIEFRKTSLIEARRRVRATQDALLDLVRSDADTQELIRARARRYVGTSGYDESDVLFELYRNAQDASGDFWDTSSLHVGKSACRISIEWDDQSVRSAHWGREINEVPDDWVVQETGKVPIDFGSDMNRMLTWAGSLISMTDPNSVKWHGHGFKSVHLVTDRPRIRSGAKSFWIQAVFLPVDLDEAMGAEMDGILGRMTGDVSTERGCTLIDLPWRTGDDALPDPIQTVTRFDTLAEFLPLFSARPLALEVGPSGHRRVIAWNERPLQTRLVGLDHGHGTEPAYPDGHPDIVTIGASPSSTSAIRFLCIQSGDCRIVLAIGPNGFERVSAEVPTFWAVTPIGRITNLGLFLAGDFEVATGRKAIRSASSRTQATISRIGGALGRFITAIASLEGADFEDFLRATGMLPHLSRNDVWTSLVQSVCGSAADTTSGTAETASDLELVRKVLWGSSSSGFARVFSDSSLPVLPSMLPGAHAGCFRPAQVQWICDGELCRHDDVLRGFLGLPGMTEIVPPGSLIDATMTRGWLGFVSPSLLEGLKPLRVATLVELIAEHPEPISDGMASKLWECVSLFVASSSATTETREVTAALGRIRFRTEEPGSPGAVSKGLMAQTGPEAVIDQDERKYAPVLDASQQLSREYGENAVRLFGACRPQGPDTSLVKRALGNLKGLRQVQAALDLFEPGATGMVPNLQVSEREVITRRVLETDGISTTDLQKLQRNIGRDAPSVVPENGAELPDGPSDPLWERLVKVAIEAEPWFLERGWSLSAQHPAATRYRMDFAVVDPSDGNVIAGIECDGHTYHSRVGEMVKDQSREAHILDSGIRMIHRIWDTRWNNNQRFELERLRLLLLGDAARIALERGGGF